MQSKTKDTIHFPGGWRNILYRSGQLLQYDQVIAGTCAATALGLYAITVVPFLLDGDQGQFQYIASTLGIPYPPGFPLYLVLGFLWSHIPIGSLALRMNLLSAVCGAGTVGFFYLTLRLQKIHRLPALLACITLALVPALWKYSTSASEHALNNLLTVLLVACLSIWLRTKSTKSLLLLFLVFGLGISNHPSFMLLAPATAVLLLMDVRFWKQPHISASAIGAGAVVGLLYLYFPLRGSFLSHSPMVTSGWSNAMAHGLVSVFFKESPGGLLRYVTASQFSGGLLHTWSWSGVLGDLGQTLMTGLNPFLLGLAVPGGIQMFRTRQRLGIWFAVALLTMALVAPQFIYSAIGQDAGQDAYFEKFLQPAFILLILLAGWGMAFLLAEASKLLLATGHYRAVPLVALSLVAVMMPVWGDLISKHSNETLERSLEVKAKWETIEKYPPEANAALVGQWGDLTPLGYLQSADHWRPDILGFYPPQDALIDQLLAEGRPVYIAGDLLGSAPDTIDRKSLVPWGPLVRVSNNEMQPPSPLKSKILTFGEAHPLVKMLGNDLTIDSRQGTLDIATYWQVLDALPLDTYLIYFSLSAPSQAQPDVKSAGESLVVSWLSDQTLQTGQRALGTYRYKIPAGLAGGTYQVNLFLYSTDSSQNLNILETGMNQTLIGTVTIDEQGRIVTSTN